MDVISLLLTGDLQKSNSVFYIYFIFLHRSTEFYNISNFNAHSPYK